MKEFKKRTLTERLGEHIPFCRQCEIGSEYKERQHPFFMSAGEAKKIINALKDTP